MDAHLDPREGRNRGAVSDDGVRFGEHSLFQSADSSLLVAGYRTPYVVELRPSAEFNYEAGKNRLGNIRLHSDVERLATVITPGNENHGLPDDFDSGYEAGYSARYGKLLRLSGLVNLESRLTIGCCGAVLAYLGRRKAVEYLPGDAAADLAFRVSTIEMFNLKNTM